MVENRVLDVIRRPRGRTGPVGRATIGPRVARGYVPPGAAPRSSTTSPGAPGLTPSSALAAAVLVATVVSPGPPGRTDRPTPASQEAAAEADGHRQRSLGLLGGWGHSWRPGLPGWGQTRSEVSFVAFHPQMGWFLTDRLEMYGEATLLVYGEPEGAVSGGVAPLALRYHLRDEGTWRPYVTVGAGVLWTSLGVVEIDRTFNFQVLYGIGIRTFPSGGEEDDGQGGPGWMLEFRNHHISNAGTEPPNIGLNAATVIGGLTWVIR